jgi:hypothetical protein
VCSLYAPWASDFWVEMPSIVLFTVKTGVQPLCPLNTVSAESRDCDVTRILLGLIGDASDFWVEMPSIVLFTVKTGG